MSEWGHDTPSATDAGAGEVVEIERSIERTQGAMSGTLDAIQEKLNPGALMEQARGPVEDTSDHIVAEVQRAVRESVDHIIGEARGPIEELGEHLIARVTSAAEEATDHILAQARTTATEAASDIVARTGEAVRAATIGKVEHMVQTVGNTTRDAANTANDTTKGLGAAVKGTIEQNPLPAALAAIGLGWLYLKRPTGASRRSAPTSYPSYQAGPTGQHPLGNTIGNAAGTVGSAVGNATDTVGSAVGSATDTVGSAVGSATDTVGNTVGSAAGAVGDTVSTAAGAVGEALGTTASTVGNTIGSAAGAVGDTVGGAAAGTQDVARGLVGEIQHQASQVGTGFQKLAQENPLAVGVAGVALGSLIGLLVPETAGERQLMGGARDTLMDKAAETAQDTMQKVGSVAQKAEGAAESAVKDEAKAQGLGE